MTTLQVLLGVKVRTYLHVGGATVVGATLMGVVFVCANANVWPGKTGETCGFISSTHM